jgi:hypothetical protein
MTGATATAYGPKSLRQDHKDGFDNFCTTKDDEDESWHADKVFNPMTLAV